MRIRMALAARAVVALSAPTAWAQNLPLKAFFGHYQGNGIAEPQKHRMLAGLETPVASYIRALEFRKHVESAYESHLVGIDAYVTPTSPIVPEPIAEDPTEERPPQAKFRNTSVFDNTHQPSISVPNGFDADGLPTGLMISTALFEDARALRIGHAYQQATQFHLQRPSL